MCDYFIVLRPAIKISLFFLCIRLFLLQIKSHVGKFWIGAAWEKQKQPHTAAADHVWSQSQSHNFWFSSPQSFSILALFYVCFYARAAPKGDCFHSFSSMSCSPPCTTEERVWIPTLMTTTTTRFLFIKDQAEARHRWGEKEPHHHQRSWLTCNRCLWVSERRRWRWELTLVVWEWPRAAGSAERWRLELVTVLLLVSALEGW